MMDQQCRLDDKGKREVTWFWLRTVEEEEEGEEEDDDDDGDFERRKQKLQNASELLSHKKECQRAAKSCKNSLDCCR